MMKTFNSLSLFFLTMMFVSSCRKSDGFISLATSFNVINAIPASQPIIPVFGTTDTISYFANAQSISYMNSGFYSPESGSKSLYIVQASDTTEISPKFELFNGILTLEPGKIYSLFLAGDTLSPDTILVTDVITTFKDSSAGVRIINLCQKSGSISINLQGNLPSQTEFNNLGYRQISSFKSYPVNLISGNSPSYTFEIRDQASGILLTTYNWNYSVFRNNTIVISGSEDPSAAFPVNAFQYNNF